MSCCPDNNVEQTRYKCEKHQVYLCDACLKCKDPELYCKFRPSCMIHFLEKEKKNGQADTKSL
jgi:hypothetical protein